MNFEKALRLPFENGGLVKVIIGAVLNLIPVVNFLCTGYFIEILEKTVRDEPCMPAWEGWGEKFVKGLVAFVISFVYMLVPVVVFTIACVFNNGLSVVLILAIMIALAIWFMLPMALAHYAATGSFGASFCLGTIFSYIRTAAGDYLGVYLLSILLFIIMAVIYLIPVLGWLVCLLGGFYTGCVLSFLFGEVYRKTSRAGGVDTGINV